MSALSATALASLADEIEDRLDDKRADRQAICEDVAVWLRTMAAATVGGSREDGADQRVTSAREYLDGTRRRKVTELPPSLLTRECAELRRCLGQVLDVVDGGQMLTGAQLATVVDGLAVAAEYRRFRASLTCQACAQHPAELCEDHAADLDRAADYDHVAGQIGDAR